MKKIVSSLMIASYLANQSINVSAKEINNADISNSQHVVQAKENSDIKMSRNSLDVVYLDGSKSVSGSGATADDAVNTFEEAIDLVSYYGTIYVSGDVVIPNDVNMPNKTIYIKQEEGGNKGKLEFRKKLYLNNMLYIKDIGIDFSSDNKDCIFINGNYLETTNVQITGRPNIFIGAEDKNINSDITGSLNIYNNKFNSNPIGDINLGGKNGYTIDAAAFSIKGVNVEGTINGDNAKERSIVYVEGSSRINSIKNIKKISVYDDVVLDIKGELNNIRESYIEGTVRVKNGSKINSEYIYGTFTLDVDVPDNNALIEGNYVKTKSIVGNINLSDKLTREGYRINKIQGNDSIEFDLFNRETSNIATNYAPVIKNLSTITLKEGHTIDLELGVKAWDFEDKDITDKIVFPKVDLTKLSVGQYKLTYEVTDSNNNKTTMDRIINVISSEAPKINGVDDITIKVGELENFDLLNGITATDNLGNYLKVTTDGKIDKPSPGTNKSSTITYTAKDSDGNITTATRVITVTNQIPVINGLDEIFVREGDEVDLLSGVTSFDVEDGNITNNIAITGTVNANKEGIYKLIYIVADSDGNITETERMVVVEKSNEVVPPTEELKPLLPPVIVEAINNNLVTLNPGTGLIDDPVEIEFNNISDDKVDALLSDIKNLNTTINSIEDKDGYIFVNISILKDDNYETFKVSDTRSENEEIHVVLKAKNEYTNIVDKLREFAKDTGDVEDSKDDNLNGNTDNDTDNNVDKDDNLNGNIDNDTDNNMDKDDNLSGNTDNNADNNINEDGNSNSSVDNNVNKNDTINENINSDNDSTIKDNPKTGDYVNIGALGLLGSLSLSGIILSAFRRKKNKK